MPVEIILRFTAMGDLLLAIPTARALAARGSLVHWVIHRRWAPLAPFLPARIHLFEGISDLLPLANRLRSLRPIRVHDLQGKPSSVILASLLGAPVSRYRKRNWWDNLRSVIGEYPLHPPDSRPVWQRYLDTAGAGSSPPDGRLVWAEGRLAAARAWVHQEYGLQEGSFVLFHPGASQPGKVMSEAAIQAFLENLPNPVVIGDRPEPALPEGFLDLRGRVPLEQLPGLMAVSRGLVSSDSGPMHLAGAIGIPVAGVFLQTDPGMGFSPLPSVKTKVISRSLPCKPCSLHGERGSCPAGSARKTPAWFPEQEGSAGTGARPCAPTSGQEGTWACRDLPWADLARETAAFLEGAG